MQNQNIDTQFMKPLKQTILDISHDPETEVDSTDIPVEESKSEQITENTTISPEQPLSPAEEIPDNSSTDKPTVETNLDKMSQNIIENLKKE